MLAVLLLEAVPVAVLEMVGEGVLLLVLVTLLVTEEVTVPLIV